MTESNCSLLANPKVRKRPKVMHEDIHLRAYRMSFVDDVLTSDEKRYLKLVEDADINGLKFLLKSKKKFSFDCCDYKGRRALDIAVKQRDIPLIEFLLQELEISGLHYYCAILTAVLENDVYILEILLTRVSETYSLEECLHCLIGGGPECIRCLPEVTASNLTPLMVAALEGNIEIAKMFLERKYAITKPHSPHCTCQTCCSNRANTGETLTESMSRMNAYRTLASPTYLILTSCDPILAAFQLSNELENLSCELPENQKEYKELSRQCSSFAADLLDECRTTEEVKILLSQKLGCPDNKPQKLNRFVTAVHYGQKQFVTHPNCQQVLRSIWVEGLPWYSWTSKARAVHVLKQSFLMPIICIAYAVVPNAKKIKALDIPINRFIYFTASYCIFLFLLLLTLLCDRFNGSTKALVNEILVGLWILGFFLDLLLKYLNGCKGIVSFYKAHNYDSIMSLLFVLSEILFLLKRLKVLGGPTNRRDMSGCDPVLIGDAIYAAASIMAYCRLLIWCKLNCHLGPLTVSLRHMLGDVLRFFVLFNVIVLAFSIGMNSMYKYYENSELCAKSGGFRYHGNEFQTLFQTGNNLFWALFGKGEPHFADIYNCRNMTTKDTPHGEVIIDENRHYFTEAIGYGMWGMYHFIACLVVLNMLIGMMAESYQRVQENADMEWKFACSTLWLSVFDSYSLVPPPFNLFPSKEWFLAQYKWIKTTRKVRKYSTHSVSSEKMKNSIKSYSTKRKVVEEMEKAIKKKADEEKYEKLMVKLIRRYLHSNGLKETTVGSISTRRCCWKVQNENEGKSKCPPNVNLRPRI